MDEDKSRRRNVHPPQPGPAAGQKHDADPRHGKHEGEDLDDDDAAFSSSSRPDSTEASALHADRAVVIPAADVNGGDTVKIGIEPPTFEQVVKFMLPTLGMLLANPILSMVDTAFVGRYNNRQSLGALAPSTAACDQAIYLASIISVATVREIFLLPPRTHTPCKTKPKAVINESISADVVDMNAAVLHAMPC